MRAERPLVYNMRPEGCQETGPRSRQCSRNLQISNQFCTRSWLDAARNAGPILDPMTNRRVVVAAVCSLVSRVLAWPAASSAQAIQRVDLRRASLDEAGAPVPDLGPSDFLVREDNWRARCCASRRPTSRCRSRCWSTTARRPATTSRDYPRRRCRRSSTALDAIRHGAKHQVALIAIGERPTILTDYTSDLAELQQGHRAGSSRLPGSGAYLLDGDHRSRRKGFKKREAQRPVIVAITHRGTRVQQPLLRPGARAAARRRRRAFTCIIARHAVE